MSQWWMIFTRWEPDAYVSWQVHKQQMVRSLQLPHHWPTTKHVNCKIFKAYFDLGKKKKNYPRNGVKQDIKYLNSIRNILIPKLIHGHLPSRVILQVVPWPSPMGKWVMINFPILLSQEDVEGFWCHFGLTLEDSFEILLDWYRRSKLHFMEDL